MKFFYAALLVFPFFSCNEINDLIASSKDGEPTIYGGGKTTVHRVEKPKEIKRYFIEPHNGSLSNPFLLAFVENLKKVVAKKDTTALFSMLDPNVISGNGSFDRGIDAFKLAYKLDQPEKSPFWKLLHRQLQLGGVTEEQNGRYYFCIPYTASSKAFAQYDYDYDWYHTAVCVVEKSIVYEAPDEKSLKAGVLNYDIVEFDPDFNRGVFTKIKSIDQQHKGFVKTSDLAFTDEPHLEIVEIESEYKIVAYTKHD